MSYFRVSPNFRSSQDGRPRQLSTCQRDKISSQVGDIYELLKQKGRSIRFQVASSLPMIAGIYAGLVRKLLRDKPNARVVILTPEIERAEEIRRAFLQEQELPEPTLIFYTAASATKRQTSDNVIICVNKSSRMLEGQHFLMKIQDEALQRPSWTMQNLKKVSAEFVGEFSFSFGSAKVDYMYSLQEACFEGHIPAVHCFVLPLAEDDAQQFCGLAQLIQSKEMEWSPMLVSFPALPAASNFSQRLQKLGVSAEAITCPRSQKYQTKRNEVMQRLEEKKLSVVCMARGGPSDFAVKGLETVILASRGSRPERRPKSLRYLQMMVQAQKDFRPRPMKLFETICSDQPERQIQEYLDHFGALEPNESPIGEPQVYVGVLLPERRKHDA
ncbi:unnamed protein product [Durusdinium trenchii]|uniref:Helicase ATP-binding domain-containing protein n=1 Tax=Durusdinium trenchii TaxID=1381693 RepID=A0ABP0RRK7_9DINO